LVTVSAHVERSVDLEGWSGLELTERFVVPADIDRVWALFDDVPEVVTCMPGAEVTERVDEHTYKAKLTIAVGPIRPKFDVRATVERDDAAKEGRIAVQAADRRGGSQARALITYRLVAEAGETAVELIQNVTLSGPLAQFGRTGVIEDVNAQMTRKFAECLAAKLSSAPVADSSADAAEGTQDSGSATSAAQAAPAKDIKIVRLVLGTLVARTMKALHLRK
jgi:uncharacterized protein